VSATETRRGGVRLLGSDGKISSASPALIPNFIGVTPLNTDDEERFISGQYRGRPYHLF
jgi:hypothetical protein